MTPSPESILSYYTPEGEESEWYPDALRACRAMAYAYDSTPRKVAGVIAALSPMMSWEQNQVAARAVLGAVSHGAIPRVGIGGNVRKAWAIACGAARPLEVLRGPKVRSFYRNLTGDLQPVTVDRWAARAAGVPDTYPSTPKRYAEVSNAYRAAAATVGAAPAVVQSVSWVAIRGGAS